MEVLIIDDEKPIRDAVRMIVEDADHYAECVGTETAALERAKEENFDLVLLDYNLGPTNGLELLPKLLAVKPQLAVVMLTAQGTIQLAVEAMRLGAIDFLEKPFTPAQLHIAMARAQKYRAAARQVVELKKEVASVQPEPFFESTSPAVGAVLDVLFRAAPSQASILILGESGTGKSVAARAVHERSQRAGKPLITVNCPSLSRELLESELFGHVKGSFTGAVRDAWGKVKAAEGGTLFLDEIGELPQEIQAKLLRLLQDREYERVGEAVVRKADVRIIAATNRDLLDLVKKGQFREDLFYRLNVISVVMPPLRDRPSDLLVFAERYLEFFARQVGRKMKGFSEAAKRMIQLHGWPGNLRELRNAIERAVILSHELVVTPADLPAIQASAADASGQVVPAVGEMVSLAELEHAHIMRLIARCESLAEAADVLGIDPATLYRKRKRAEAESRREPAGSAA
ncbi:MAG: sigma-54-dependent Fis family transcriptional regulator [Verrucomicrobia bacterium]|nr:sigma-54-dependent Fis family transcriptional regulator [Verrucomicrobiota bacterium]